MEYVLPTLVIVLILVVLFRRAIKRASRRWLGEPEDPPAREKLAEFLDQQRQKLRDRRLAEERERQQEPRGAPQERSDSRERDENGD